MPPRRPATAPLRKKLTYSNVVSTVCLFLLLGGGAAYAASHLGKNSVGPKQLKRNAVTTTKIKQQAVTAEKIKDGTITGRQIDSSTLGKVPVAELANSIAQPEGWHLVGAPGEPLFQNSWKDSPTGPGAPEPVAFFKDREGVVHLKGIAVSGTPSKTVFQLPPGFRPAAGRLQSFAVACGCGGQSAGAAVIYGPENGAQPDGGVSVPGASSFSLDGISFRAES
jgi:hypothetical protein